MLARNPWKGMTVFAIVGLALAGSVFFCLWSVRAEQEAVKRRAEAESQSWRELVERVKTGQCDTIYLPYGPQGVDDKCRDIEQLAGLRALNVEGGDLTARGLASIARVPDLRRLRLYGGTWLGNKDFAALAGNTSIEQIELTYMDAHHEPLTMLADLPSLRELTIFDRESKGKPNLTEDAWLWLGKLRQLKSLKVGGSGMTDHCIHRLREVLPGVSIEYLKEEPSVR